MSWVRCDYSLRVEAVGAVSCQLSGFSLGFSFWSTAAEFDSARGYRLPTGESPPEDCETAGDFRQDSARDLAVHVVLERVVRRGRDCVRVLLGSASGGTRRVEERRYPLR